MADQVGKWAFLAGVILAVVVGLIPPLQIAAVSWILLILGLVIGFLNVTAKESTAFLVASIALIVLGTGLPNAFNLGSIVNSILANIVTIVSGAAVIVAVKAIADLAGKR